MHEQRPLSGEVLERRGAIDGDYRDRFRDFNRGACKPEASHREFDPAL
jgi:hypothetical protein